MADRFVLGVVSIDYGPGPGSGVGGAAIVRKAGDVELGIERGGAAVNISEFEEVLRRQERRSATGSSGRKCVVDPAQRVGELVLDDRGEVDCGRAGNAAREIIRASAAAAKVGRVAGKPVDRVAVQSPAGQRLVLGIRNEKAVRKAARIGIGGGQIVVGSDQ